MSLAFFKELTAQLSSARLSSAQLSSTQLPLAQLSSPPLSSARPSSAKSYRSSDQLSSAQFSSVFFYKICNSVPASFHAIDFVVTRESRVVERVVVTQTAVAAVRMFRTLLFVAFSANTLANAIFASFGKVDFAGEMAETLVRDALVLDAKLVQFAVGLANTSDGLANCGAAAFWTVALVAMAMLN